jgi:5-(carboxyamino)imidazole ribonucleotide mutase
LYIQQKINLKLLYIMKVGVIMGSTSDLEVMTPAIETLLQFGIEVEKRVISAHRAPHELMRWTESARERGLSIIIAGAGGAAHLAGVIAGLTSLPVIGVPVRSKTLDGLDSLLSIVQMPAGIPVATVAINGSKNAALLAIAILALQDAELLAKLEAFRKEQTEKVVNTVI